MNGSFYGEDVYSAGYYSWEPSYVAGWQPIACAPLEDRLPRPSPELVPANWTPVSCGETTTRRETSIHGH